MNTEQERAEFEAWLRSKWTDGYGCPKNANGSYVDPIAQLLWESRQAGRAALQSQDREDAARLDWLQQSDGRFFKLLHITSIVGRGFSPTNSSDKWFSSLRGAIDHARRTEGDSNADS